MKKPKPPKNIEEVETYIREKGISIDPQFFWDFFETENWHDTNGKPVLSWKQKLLTWSRMQHSWGGSHKCYLCKKPGVYPAGKDRDGHPQYRCLDHKAKWTPSLPAQATISMKSVPEADVNVNDERNRQMNKLLGRN